MDFSSINHDLRICVDGVTALVRRTRLSTIWVWIVAGGDRVVGWISTLWQRGLMRSGASHVVAFEKELIQLADLSIPVSAHKG
jgi:hypothetical protein